MVKSYTGQIDRKRNQARESLWLLTTRQQISVAHVHWRQCSVEQLLCSAVFHSTTFQRTNAGQQNCPELYTLPSVRPSALTNTERK